ncbi:hypothetical protein [Roseovarius sp.]|uniref:hypothetical protein n=1 Tax=Roseovarius sp. TaxID=1486281 RepID=UPI000C50E42A|nr:hypothetical protein [Roseovarius sp.]MAZ22098.1 hypothetical protein [Roseovarius sp.]|tara:strand:- start:525 stop:926 length:402 start_codon:yes stop_codon:yes gene_type:complete
MEEIETRLFVEFHSSRIASMAAHAVTEMQGLRPGGLFAAEARISNLWEEACWALHEHSDTMAGEAASSVLRQFSQAEVSCLSDEELRLHCYLITDECDEEGMPWADAEAVASKVAEEIRWRASHFDIDRLSRG